MATSTPRVTVGVPVYNGDRFLREALDGLLAQTYRDFVLLVSDNASTDHTPEICEEYARQDGRVRYVRQEINRGAAWNFNTLVDVTTTPLFMWHAADDVARPRLLEACVARLDQRSDAVLAYTESELIDERGDPTPYTPRPMENGSPDVARRFEACLSPGPLSESVIYGMMRTATLKRTQRHGNFAGGDRALLAELVLHGPFTRIDEPLLRRRVFAETRTEAETQAYNTGRPAKLSLREWRILRQNLRSIRRGPLSISGRLGLYAVVLRHFIRRRSLYEYELRQVVKVALGLRR